MSLCCLGFFPNILMMRFYGIKNLFREKATAREQTDRLHLNYLWHFRRPTHQHSPMPHLQEYLHYKGDFSGLKRIISLEEEDQFCRIFPSQFLPKTNSTKLPRRRMKELAALQQMIVDRYDCVSIYNLFFCYNFKALPSLNLTKIRLLRFFSKLSAFRNK